MEQNLFREGERIDTVNEHLRLIQKKDGLTFGTDAYLLAAFMRPQPKGRAVELARGRASSRCCARRGIAFRIFTLWRFKRILPRWRNGT